MTESTSYRSTPRADRIFRFGQFELHEASGELSHKGRKLRLQEQPLQILLALLEHPGEVVTRDELRSRLWREDTFVDFDQSMNAAVKRLRKTLGDDADNARFVETLPKRGYRLLVSVTSESASAEEEDSAQTLLSRPISELASQPPSTLMSEKTEQRTGPRWAVRLFAAIGVLAVASLFLFVALEPARQRPARRYSIVLPADFPLAPASLMPLGVGRPNLIVSKTGELFVYVGVTGSTTQLFLRTNDGKPPRRIPGTEGANSPFFSPDEKWIAFFTGGKLKKVLLTGGPVISLCDVVLGFGGSWAKDDTIYFTPSEFTPIYKIAASGGTPVQVTEKRSYADPPALQYWPEVLPSGKGILLANSRFGIYVYDIANHRYNRLTRTGSYPRWSSTGHILFVDDGLLWALPFNERNLESKGDPQLVFDEVRMEQQGASQFAVSAEGTLFYAQGGDATEASLVWADRNGAVTDVGLPPRRYGEFQLSPDGKTLAVIIRDQLRSDLWAYDLERKTLTRLTDDGRSWAPVWSLDGRKIVYAFRASGTPVLCEMTPDGNGKRNIASITGLLMPSSFLPDGKSLLVSAVDSSGNLFYVVNTESGEMREFERSKHMRVFPALSPNGRWLAYVSDETGRWEIYVRALEGDEHRWRITTEGGEEPIWDSRGQRLFYRNGDQWMQVAISNIPFRAGQPVKIIQGPYVNIPGYSYNVASDGRLLLLKSEYQDKKTSQVEVVENWPALVADGGKK